MVYDEGLIHDIDGAVGDKLLEVVGEGLAAEIKPADAIVEGEVVEDGGGMDKRKAAVDDEAAAVLREARPPASFVKMDQGGGIRHAQRLETKVLEDELVRGSLDGGGVEKGLHKQKRGVSGVGAQERPEDAVPDLALEVGVDEVTAV